MSGELATWLGAATPNGGPAWLGAWRADARERASALGVPGSKQEAWRYTNPRRLFEQAFDEGAAVLAAEALAPLLVEGLEADRVVLVNGRYAPEHGRLGALPEGVRIDSLARLLAEDPEAVRPHLGALADDPAALFPALNAAGGADGLVLLLAPGARLERPLELLHVTTGERPTLAQPRHLIVLGEGAEARLVERYVGAEPSIAHATNAVLEIDLAAEARLDHERIQHESAESFHLSTLYLRQQARSRYQGLDIGLGGRWARTDINTRFAGPGAECALHGLYLSGDGQLIDYHLDVDHAVPDCTSVELFKGILYGQGRAVFDGRVFVAQDAQRTDAAMSNRNLMLSERAEIDTKPQLEINADDVKCSHGTTVGQIDPQMLFYLRARGIPEASARRMLCLGFAEEIIGRLGDEALRAEIAALVGDRLEAAPLD
ncbi:Fe-S cluster assembly protein SufD [Marichromatium gracile]|uniref:Fe-S cluster assembly protein SufD n=1 Tax=Marichromatium gracile TaxID=1048 RepID=A0ABR5VHG4_MARGR|nr:Fe-S cluster assembly protein SufD [Marichromatium gracile]KXX65160.1 Fe-S cluster assembly protein SufD [Marichromatium gracile]